MSFIVVPDMYPFFQVRSSRCGIATTGSYFTAFVWLAFDLCFDKLPAILDIGFISLVDVARFVRFFGLVGLSLDRKSVV